MKWVDNRQVVFRVEDGKAIPSQPELGLAGLNDTEVLGGLQAGDTVATQIVLPGGKKSSGQAAPSGPPGQKGDQGPRK